MSLAHAIKQEWLPAVPPPSNADIIAVLQPLADKFLAPDDYGYPDETTAEDFDDTQQEEVFVTRAQIRAARELIARLTPQPTKPRSEFHVTNDSNR